jgi:hypothetical protein
MWILITELLSANLGSNKVAAKPQCLPAFLNIYSITVVRAASLLIGSLGGRKVLALAYIRQ